MGSKLQKAHKDVYCLDWSGNEEADSFCDLLNPSCSRETKKVDQGQETPKSGVHSSLSNIWLLSISANSGVRMSLTAEQ